MIRAGREVAAGRVDLERHEPAWERLRRIPHVGSWTLEKLAVGGQGRDDQLPAGDLAYVKLVGRLEGLGRRATEDEVRAFFAPYAPSGALAALYALGAELTRRPRGQGHHGKIESRSNGPVWTRSYVLLAAHDVAAAHRVSPVAVERDEEDPHLRAGEA